MAEIICPTDAQAKQLFVDGHDIASHTVTHQRTADLTPEEQRKVIILYNNSRVKYLGFKQKL